MKKKKENKLLKTLITRNELGALIPLVIILIIVAFGNPKFYSVKNILDIIRTGSFSFYIAAPLTFLLTAGGMDQSIGSILSFGGVLYAKLIVAGVPVAPSVLICLIAGAIIGWINGVIIVKYNQPAFIATLGTQYIISGAVLVWTGGISVSGLTPASKIIGQYYIGDVVPIPIIYAIIIGIVCFIVLDKTKWGRSLAAIGGNQETAYLAGIPVVKRQIFVYVLVGISATFTGVIWAARFANGLPGAGDAVNMKNMAAVIIGGTSPAGGNGTIVGTAIGCVLLATITNFLVFIGIPATAQQLIFGIILILAIFIDRYRRQVLSRG